MDLYSPTFYTLQKIKPYLIDGAIILFDEFYNYLDWQNGEYKALIELFKKNEYEYKGYTINSTQVFIKIKKLQFEEIKNKLKYNLKKVFDYKNQIL